MLYREVLYTLLILIEQNISSIEIANIKWCISIQAARFTADWYFDQLWQSRTNIEILLFNILHAVSSYMEIVYVMYHQHEAGSIIIDEIENTEYIIFPIVKFTHVACLARWFYAFSLSPQFWKNCRKICGQDYCQFTGNDYANSQETVDGCVFWRFQGERSLYWYRHESSLLIGWCRFINWLEYHCSGVV